MTRLWRIGLVLCLAALGAAAPIRLMTGTAGALSCVDPLERLHQMSLVVRARVVAVPEKQWAKLEVERYYRGTGPTTLYVEYRGVDRSYAWARTPAVGGFDLMELRQDGKGIYTGPCDLALPAGSGGSRSAQAVAYFGEGQPPEPDPTGGTAAPSGTSAPGSTRGRWALYAGAAVGAAGVGWMLFCRRRLASPR